MDKIAVATDFSAHSERAVQRAQLIARKTGAELVFIHIVDDDQPEAVIASSRRIATSAIGEMVRRLEHEGVVATPLIGEGDVAGGILAAADAVDADLIVVGPHRKRLSDVFIGTTVDRIIRRSERPVLVAVAAPAAHHRRSLLAVDFDDASKAAGHVALELGVFDHTDVVVMHAFDPMGDGVMLRTVVPPSEVDDYRAAERVNTISTLHALLAELSLPVSTVRLVAMIGSPARTILESADREAADLIVVGTSQRKGFARLMVGSIASDAIRDTQRDILVAPTAGLRSAPKARVVLPRGRDPGANCRDRSRPFARNMQAYRNRKPRAGDSPPRSKHMQEPSQRDASVRARALARWEGEGGALAPSVEEDSIDMVTSASRVARIRTSGSIATPA